VDHSLNCRLAENARPGRRWNHPARRISLRSSSARLNSTRTTDHASALQRVCSITRRTRLMRSHGARGGCRSIKLAQFRWPGHCSFFSLMASGPTRRRTKVHGQTDPSPRPLSSSTGPDQADPRSSTGCWRRIHRNWGLRFGIRSDPRILADEPLQARMVVARPILTLSSPRKVTGGVMLE